MVENKLTSNQIIRNLNKELIDDCVKGVMKLIDNYSKDIHTDKIIEEKKEKLIFFVLRIIVCIPSAVPVKTTSVRLKKKLNPPLTTQRAVRELYLKLDKKFREEKEEEEYD